MSRHQTERNQFNRRIKPDSRFAPLPHEGEVRNEEEPCLTTPKDACGVLERFSRSSKGACGRCTYVGGRGFSRYASSNFVSRNLSI